MSTEQLTSMENSQSPNNSADEKSKYSLEFQSRKERILQSCPVAGDGVNDWLFRAALKFHRMNIEPDEIEQLLEEATLDCGRSMKPNEIERAVRNSHPNRLKDRPLRRRWPERNYEQIEAVGLSGCCLNDLENESPVSLSVSDNQAEVVIDELFPGDPLVCAGRSNGLVLTRRRSEWRGFLASQEFIVPSPMLKRKGRTQEGIQSFRTLENVGPRLFLVIEFDFVAKNDLGFTTPMAPVLERLAAAGRTTSDLCAAIHAHLADMRPLALIVHSGGKSLHGWYPCAGDQEEETMHRFMRFAVSLGADPATWTRVQWVRMPDGIRNNGERQRILYFNPAALKGVR